MTLFLHSLYIRMTSSSWVLMSLCWPRLRPFWPCAVLSWGWGYLHLSQCKYVTDLLTDTGFLGARFASTMKLAASTGAPASHRPSPLPQFYPSRYHLWCAASQSICSFHEEVPIWDATLHLRRYLRGSTSWDLFYIAGGFSFSPSLFCVGRIL